MNEGKKKSQTWHEWLFRNIYFYVIVMVNWILQLVLGEVNIGKELSFATGMFIANFVKWLIVFTIFYYVRKGWRAK